MGHAMQGFHRSRLLLARNRAFTPYNGQMTPMPIQARLLSTPRQEQLLRRMGELPVSIEAFERHGSDYPGTYPQILQQRTNLDDVLGDLLVGGVVNIGTFRLNKGTVADRLRFWMDTAIDDTFQLLQFTVTVNGQPFTQQNNFTLPFVQGPETFFRRMISLSQVGIQASLRPGAVPLPPIGLIDVQMFVDAYTGKFAQ